MLLGWKAQPTFQIVPKKHIKNKSKDKITYISLTLAKEPKTKYKVTLAKNLDSEVKVFARFFQKAEGLILAIIKGGMAIPPYFGV